MNKIKFHGGFLLQFMLLFILVKLLLFNIILPIGDSNINEIWIYFSILLNILPLLVGTFIVALLGETLSLFFNEDCFELASLYSILTLSICYFSIILKYIIIYGCGELGVIFFYNLTFVYNLMIFYEQIKYRRKNNTIKIIAVKKYSDYLLFPYAFFTVYMIIYIFLS